jgi:hypothetical protein
MVTISKYYSSVTKTGVKPSNPGNVVTVIPEVLNPPDSPVSHSPVTIGSPANGLSLVGQELSLGLASAGVTGALSGTDWDTFNGKIGGTIASGQVAFGTGVNTVGGDSGLVWDNTNKLLFSNFIRLKSDNQDNTFIGRLAGESNTFLSLTQGNYNTFIGSISGRFNTTGYAQTFVGFGAGGNNTTGNGNTNIGYQSGFSNSVGISNTNVGTDAGARNKGNHNTFIGWHSGFGFTIFSTGDNNNFFGSETALGLTSGSDNNGFGRLALRNLTTGNKNNCFGTQSGASITSGINNNTFGSETGRVMTTATNNSFFGHRVGFNITTGYNSSFFGSLSGFRVTTGYFNSLFGNDSGQFLTTGIGNVAVGNYSLMNITTQSYNTAIGFNSGRFISGGTILSSAQDSIFIGSETRALASGQSNQIVIGHQAIGNGSNTVVIGNSSIVSNRFFGTLRIGTISNAVGNFLTTSATGVVQQRTATETRTDIGAFPSASLSIASGQVAFGTGVNTVGGDSGLTWDNVNKRLGVLTSSPSVPIDIVRNVAGTDFSSRAGVRCQNSNAGGAAGFFVVNNSGLTGGFQFTGSSYFTGYNNVMAIFSPVGFDCIINANGNSVSGGGEVVRIRAGGYTSVNDIATFSSSIFTLLDGKNMAFGTTTGTKIGTATTQKLSFWNATPIIQPTTAVTAATLVSNAGTTLTSTDTFDGYTLAQIVKALRNTGLLS